MNNIKFSIITICFNSEKTIERTLQSVLAQTFIDYEYIIVDQFAESYVYFNYLKEKTRGSVKNIWKLGKKINEKGVKILILPQRLRNMRSFRRREWHCAARRY